MRRSIISLFIISVMAFHSGPAAATEEADKLDRLEHELHELKNQFIEMQKLYELKIAHLEAKIHAGQTDILPNGYSSHRCEKDEKEHWAPDAHFNPDINIIVDVKQRFNDDVGDDNRHKLTVGEAELEIGGHVCHGIRGDSAVSLENEYSGESDVDTEADLEEAYLTFFELPLNSQLIVGRKLIDFGIINAQHPHEWAFTDTPLVLHNLFGDHPWYDDGFQVSTLIPNPANILWDAKFGIWNGRNLGHNHSHDDEEETESPRRFNLENQAVQFDDHVYTARTYMNIPCGANFDAGFGYSVAWDEEPQTILHGFDLTMRYRFPDKNSWLKWQNEYIFAKLDPPVHQHQDNRQDDATPHGLYSLLEYAIDRHWRLGTRLDYAEYNEDDSFYQWAASAFLTYHFNHNLYIRGTYRYRDFSDFYDMHQEPENTVWLQFVWGIGAHAHGIDDKERSECH